MDLGKLLNEWLLLKKNSLSVHTFEQYVKAFGSYHDCLNFNIYRDSFLGESKRGAISKKLAEIKK